MSFVPPDSDESADPSPAGAPQSDGTDTDDHTEQAEAMPEIVELAWGNENDNAGKPLPAAIKANSRMIEDLLSKEQSEVVGLAIQELQDDVAKLQDENRELRTRLNRLESWKTRATNQLDGLFTNLQMLLTASNIDAAGICPICRIGTLEVRNPFFGTDRIECANEDCEHVAADLKWV